MTNQVDLHNQLAGEIVKSIIKPVYAAGGGPTDVLVLTESVLICVALYIIKTGGDNLVLDLMVDRARERLAEIRLRDIETKGSS